MIKAEVVADKAAKEEAEATGEPEEEGTYPERDTGTDTVETEVGRETDTIDTMGTAKTELTNW